MIEEESTNKKGYKDIFSATDAEHQQRPQVSVDANEQKALRNTDNQRLLFFTKS